VAEGDLVETGQLLVVLEAMKMEHAVHATTAGTVTAVKVSEGDQVETGRILVVVEADGAGDGDGAQTGDAGHPGNPDEPS
jgi:pyruvate/2-oxoglutarate dehydrogenase complex dihydrolipoamide acyltransferase (E2) component